MMAFKASLCFILLAPGSCVAPADTKASMVVEPSGVIRSVASRHQTAGEAVQKTEKVKATEAKTSQTQQMVRLHETKPQEPEAFVQDIKAKTLQPRDLSTYPSDLLAIGLKVFGSKEKLQDFVSNLEDPQDVLDDEVTLRLVQSKGDNSIKRLNLEMGTDQYGIRKVDANSGLIIDVGGNIGDMAITASLVHPDLQVLALEPVPSTYFLMRLNMRFSKVGELDEADFGKMGKSGILALNMGATKDGRPVKITYDIHDTQDAVTNANSDNDLMGRWDTAMVESMKINEYVESHNAGPVRLFKMDCEGCEFEVIPAMRGWFDDKEKVEKFTAEIHLSVRNKGIDSVRAAARPDQENLDETDELLKSRGCEVNSWKVDC